MASEKLEDRAAAIAVVVAAGDFKSAYSLADALRSHCPRTRELAADAIRQLTEAHITHREPGIRPEEASDFHSCTKRLGEVLKTVVESWESHLRPEALEAALWMIGAVEKPLAEKLSRVPNRIVHMLTGILERATDPRLAGFVVWSLSRSELKGTAAKAISRATPPGFLNAIVDELWSLGDPEVAKSFHGVHESSRFEQLAVEDRNISSEKAAAIVRMISCAGGPRDRNVARLCALGERAGEQVQRAVLWQLVGDESAQATQALQVIASRSQDARANIAARECHRRQYRDGTTPIRRKGDDTPGPLRDALNRFIEEHDRLSIEERDALVAEFKTLGPDLVFQLERKLESPQAADRARTIRVLKTLGQISPFLTRLYQCARDADPAVRSAALTILGDDSGAASLRLLRDALNDPDSRVQAAAIESLERRGIEHASQSVRGKLGSRNSRVRANAIKALWKLEIHQALQELDRMLADESAPHRVSALWVVERLGLRQVLERLGKMAVADPDPHVRLRARRVLEGLRMPREAGART